jgi:hypothetical protein
MKSSKLLFIVFIVSIAFSSTLQSQPKLIIHAYGAFMFPLADLGPNANRIYDSTRYLETNYGMKLGFNILTAEVKYAFGNNGNFRGILGFSYSGFLNTDELLTLGWANVYRDQMTLVTLYLGGEYAFMTKEKVIPFLGAAFTSNFISGVNTDAESRFGLQLNLGTDIITGRHFGFVGGVKLDFANLFGKESNINKPTSGQPLYDGEYTYNGKKVSAKNIIFVQIYAGFGFFFGQPKKSREKVF